MLKLTPRQRELPSEKLPDAANVAVGALFFGQFLGEQGFSMPLAVAGLALWLLLFGTALYVSGGE